MSFFSGLFNSLKSVSSAPSSGGETSGNQEDPKEKGPVPANERYFATLISIAQRTERINTITNAYLYTNQDEYKKKNPDWVFFTLANSLLKEGINTFKGRKSESTLFLNRFIRDSHQHWNQIVSKDTSYFVELAETLFSDFGDDGSRKIKFGVKEIKALYTEKKLDGSSFLSSDDEEYLWGRIYAMLRISINYIKELREEDPEAYSEVDLTPYEDFMKNTKSSTPQGNQEAQ